MGTANENWKGNSEEYRKNHDKIFGKKKEAEKDKEKKDG